MRFVVTGTARSGTGYIAAVLRAASVRCGHEGAFGPWQVLLREPPTWGELEADSSWLAVPTRARGTPAGLQVRHPLDVVRSVVGMRLLADEPVAPRAHYAYRRVIVRHAPSALREREEPDRAARYWLEWNRLADRFAIRRWRVEDVDVPLVRELAARAGHDVGEDDAERALATVSTDFNSRTYPFMRRDETVTWDHVRPALRTRVRDLAEVLGYDVE